MISIILFLIGLLIFDVLPSSLIVLSLAIIGSIVVYKIPNLYKSSTYIYIITLLFSVAGIIFSSKGYLTFVYRGYIGYAFFMIVMFTAVFPRKWSITRTLYLHRSMFSILGFILISSHAYLHLFNGYGIDLFGIVSYVLMIPLTFISFKVIKKEMNIKDWFKIQKVAYVIYIGLFVHLFFVSSGIDTVFYAVYATLYLNNRVLKEFHK